MSWGQGDHAGPTIKAVVRAFYDGKPCKRGNAETDGRTYWLFRHPIARRIPDDELTDKIADKLLGRDVGKKLEFSWAGYRTSTTQRHLVALGLDAWKGSESERDPRPPMVANRAVPVDNWFTLEEVAETPVWTAPPKKPRAERFVNLTIELFPK